MTIQSERERDDLSIIPAVLKCESELVVFAFANICAQVKCCVCYSVEGLLCKRLSSFLVCFINLNVSLGFGLKKR